MNSSVPSAINFQGLPPLPKSLAYGCIPHQNFHGQQIGAISHNVFSQPFAYYHGKDRSAHLAQGTSRTSPPRPHSRRSSSSGSSFRASPEYPCGNRNALSGPDMLRGSPRSLSSSPHSPHIDSGFGRSSADSLSEPRSFVRVISSPSNGSKLEMQLLQLKRDMRHLREQDMVLLNHLLQINKGIQDLKIAFIPAPVSTPSATCSMQQCRTSGSTFNCQSVHYPIPPARLNRKIPPSGMVRYLARNREKCSTNSDLVSIDSRCIPMQKDDEDESDSLSSIDFSDV